jgi:hypothetical protein
MSNCTGAYYVVLIYIMRAQNGAFSCGGKIPREEKPFAQAYKTFLAEKNRCSIISTNCKMK